MKTAHALPPERQLAGFIARFDAPIGRRIRQARKQVAALLPAAFQLVYDNYNFLVIGFGATARPSDAILSIAADANGLGLHFLHGAKLADPEGRLLGSGKQNRFVRLPDLAVLQEPAIRALIAAAVAGAERPLPRSGRGPLVIQSISARQRPRRK